MEPHTLLVLRDLSSYQLSPVNALCTFIFSNFVLNVLNISLLLYAGIIFEILDFIFGILEPTIRFHNFCLLL